ncbi:uncharacterized protein [Spinacia oleracea]|uniref:Uncharacterized protein isoform X2 n=1 Tax=Spinacia oleracea TaxID=3562 RepID=A0ABM3RE85_SPIOL|nr:uncharacterized protein LOC110795068 isoform X2 [Spinacia oleracea]
MAEMGMGWYGPLIDLSAAASHVGDFVQFLVFVHRSNPIQYKSRRGRGSGNGGEVVRTDIDVGDESRPHFNITLWNSNLASQVFAGDIIFFRNVKVNSFGSIVEASSVHYSSILRLIHPYHSLLSRVIGTTKDKLTRVIHWIHQTRITLCNQLNSKQVPAPRNWKEHQEQKPRECFSLSEVLHLSNSCKVNFHASIGELFLQSLWPDAEKDRLFISRRLNIKTDIIVEDMICTGCQLCGLPLCSDSTGVGKDCPLYCDKSSNRLHTVGFIYRPFMLYVWDDSEHIPLHVTNKAAELLFGNIIAENVYLSFKNQKDHQNLKNPSKEHVNIQDHARVDPKDIVSVSNMGLQKRRIKHDPKSPNLYLIWLIVLRMLLLQGENSSLTFEVLIDSSLEMEDGRFKMLSVSMS